MRAVFDELIGAAARGGSDGSGHGGDVAIFLQSDLRGNETSRFSGGLHNNGEGDSPAMMRLRTGSGNGCGGARGVLAQQASAGLHDLVSNARWYEGAILASSRDPPNTAMV